MRAAWVLLIAGACSTEVHWPGGTGVGNPGTTKVATARSPGVELRTGDGRIASFEVDRCAPGRTAEFPIDEDVDLLDTDPYPLSGGGWCALSIAFDGPLVFQGESSYGTDPDPGTVELDLDVPSVDLPIAPEILVDGEAFVLELGHPGWLSSLSLASGTHTVVDASHPAYDALVNDVTDGSALYLDADGDGALSSSEREDPVTAGSRWRPSGDE